MSTLTSDDEIDIGGIFTALRKRWWLIAMVTLLAGVVLYIGLQMIDPRYRSSARILIKDTQNTFTKTTSERNQQSLNRVDQQTIVSEVEVLTSDVLAFAVIDKLKLADRKEFQKSGTPEDKKRVKAREIFKEKLQVYPVEFSRVIVVDFWSIDPNLAQEIVEELSNEYVKRKAIRLTDTQETATQWLDPRIKELEKDVSVKEAAVAEFRSSRGLVRVTDNNALLSTQQLTQAATELSRLRAERASTEARVAAVRQALRSGASLDSVPEVLESRIVQDLSQRESELQSRVSDLSVTLLPGHPRLQSANSQLDRVRRQLRSAAQNVVTSLERNVAAVKKAEADLENEIDRLKSDAAFVEENLVELRAKEREVEAARNLLAEYKSRSIEAKSRQSLNENDAEIISPASFPSKSFFPKVVPFTAAGTGAAFLLSSLAVIAGSLLTSSGSHSASAAARYEREPAFEQANASFEADLLEAVQLPTPDMESPVGSVETDEQADTKKRNGVLASLKNRFGFGGKDKSSDDETDIAIGGSGTIPGSFAARMPGLGGAAGAGSKGQLSAERLEETTTPSIAPDEIPLADVSSVELADLCDSGAVVDGETAADALLKYGPTRIAVLSPKGSAASSATVVIARRLASLDQKVLVIDFAGGSRTTVEMIGSKRVPGFFNLLTGSVDPSQAMFVDRKSKVQVMPGGSLMPNQPMPQAIFISDMVDALAEAYDYCILDCGDTRLDDLNVVADDDTVAVVSTARCNDTEYLQLANMLERDGFEHVLCVSRDKQTADPSEQAAA